MLRFGRALYPRSRCHTVSDGGATAGEGASDLLGLVRYQEPDMDHNDHAIPRQPLPRSLVDERRRRLHALRTAMAARHESLADQTWARLLQSLAVYDGVWGLLTDVAEVKARIRASQSRSIE